MRLDVVRPPYLRFDRAAAQGIVVKLFQTSWVVKRKLVDPDEILWSAVSRADPDAYGQDRALLFRPGCAFKTTSESCCAL
jgi:hypothetical protein